MANPLYEDIRRYGREGFIYGVVEEVDKQTLHPREAYWINHYNTIQEGYNIRLPGGNPKHKQYDTNPKYRRYKYLLLPPEGIGYTTTSMVNIKLLGLNPKGMYRVARGERKQNRGWRAEIVEEL